MTSILGLLVLDHAIPQNPRSPTTVKILFRPHCHAQGQGIFVSPCCRTYIMINAYHSKCCCCYLGNNWCRCPFKLCLTSWLSDVCFCARALRTSANVIWRPWWSKTSARHYPWYACVCACVSVQGLCVRQLVWSGMSCCPRLLQDLVYGICVYVYACTFEIDPLSLQSQIACRALY